MSETQNGYLGVSQNIFIAFAISTFYIKSQIGATYFIAVSIDDYFRINTASSICKQELRIPRN